MEHNGRIVEVLGMKDEIDEESGRFCTAYSKFASQEGDDIVGDAKKQCQN